MEIHKPKAWHGLREFAKEYAIIVLGVLTALGAEQAVEWLHWRERAEEGRDRLAAEISHQYLVAEERVAVAPCLDQQLVRIEAAVLSAGPVLTPLPTLNAPVPLPFRAPSRSWIDAAWQSVVTEGLTSHLKRRERELVPIHYSQMYRFRDYNAEEGRDVGELIALSKPLPIDAGVKVHFVTIIERERLRNREMAVLAEQMMPRIHELGFEPTQTARRAWLDSSVTLNACKAGKMGGTQPADLSSPRK